MAPVRAHSDDVRAPGVVRTPRPNHRLSFFAVTARPVYKSVVATPASLAPPKDDEQIPERRMAHAPWIYEERVPRATDGACALDL
ncbi:hypothetical protein NDU88_000208 [Pleurodeles waltl]|uniref:Uncharacterized protein n=1 Tax=Pleurodeles waltl TaxID=8319 RepID=A0AAV7N799_PLEWA|nr:hypothetical protein NDU88_000208 [Pleurodeles waltl]